MNKKYFLPILCTLFLSINNSLLSQDCFIADLILEKHECNEEGEFWVDITFEYDNTSEDGFTVRGNGKNYGNFQYGEAFYTLGPIEADCRTLYEFVVIDLETEACRAEAFFDSPVCCNDCIIEVFEVEVSDCDTLNHRTVSFQLESDNTKDSVFNVSFLGIPYASFPYGEESYAFSIPGVGQFLSLLVSDGSDEECSDELNVGIENCSNQSACSFNSITVYHEFECRDNNSYDVLIYVEYEGDEDSLIVNFMGRENLLVAKTEFPVRYEDFEISNDLFVYYIHEQDNIFCYTGNEWNDAPDCSELESCGIEGLIAEYAPCTTVSADVLVDIAFEIANPPSDSFYIQGNGTVYGSFAYGQNFYTVGPVKADCRTEYEFIIVDSEDDSCIAEVGFDEPPCCGNNGACKIYDVNLDPLDCNEDGSYQLWLDFEYENANNDFFELWSGNNYLGFWPLAELPIIIDSFPPRDRPQDIIVICINDNPDCCKEYEFDRPDCSDSRDCSITDIRVDFTECKQTATGLSHGLYINFEHDNTSNEFFDLWINDQFWDYYKFDDLPIFIENFPVTDLEFNLIKICENDNEECCKYFEFRGPDCENNNTDCKIYDMFAEAGECNDAGQLFVDIEFKVENPGDAGFVIRGNGQVYDTFDYGQVYYTIGPIDAKCDKIFEFIVADLEKQCKAVYVFDKPLCCGDESECRISEIEVYEVECNNNGTINFTLDFEYTDLNSGVFLLYDHSSDVVERYAYRDLPVRIKSFKPRDKQYQFIKICDSEFDDCCKAHEFKSPDCFDNVDCFISDLRILEMDYTAAGNLIVVVDFAYQADRNVGLDIFANGQFLYYETEIDTPLEIVIENFDLNDSIYLKLCINDKPDCCSGITFFPGIETDCAISDFQVLQTVCLDNMYYLVADAVVGFNSFDAGFLLRGNGQIYGRYKQSELPVAIGPFHLDDEINELAIVMENHPDCNEEIELEISCDCISNIIEIDSDNFSITDSGSTILIESLDYTNFEVNLFNLDGRKLLSAFAAGSFVINKQNFDSGIYILRINYNGKQKTFKLFLGR